MQKCKVLIVDDAYFMRDLIKGVLEEAAFKVVGEAKTGKEAIVMYFDLKPDIVIMDINMPELDGFSAMEAILSKDDSANFLVITGDYNPEVKKKAFEVGAADFLKKPFQPAFLINKINQILIEKDVGNEKPKNISANKIPVKKEVAILLEEDDDLIDDFFETDNKPKKNNHNQEQISNPSQFIQETTYSEAINDDSDAATDDLFWMDSDDIEHKESDNGISSSYQVISDNEDVFELLNQDDEFLLEEDEDKFDEDDEDFEFNLEESEDDDLFDLVGDDTDDEDFDLFDEDSTDEKVESFNVDDFGDFYSIDLESTAIKKEEPKYDGVPKLAPLGKSSFHQNIIKEIEKNKVESKKTGSSLPSMETQASLPKRKDFDTTPEIPKIPIKDKSEIRRQEFEVDDEIAPISIKPPRKTMVKEELPEKYKQAKKEYKEPLMNYEPEEVHGKVSLLDKIKKLLKLK